MEEQEAQVPSQQGLSKKWTIILVAALLIIAVAGGAIAANLKSQNNLQFATIVKPKLNGKDTLRGIVAASNSETLYLDPSKGKIQTVFVKEGQDVKKGEKLFEYDTTNLDNQLNENAMNQRMDQLDSEAAQKEIDSLQKEISALKAQASIDTEMTLSRQEAEQESKKELADLNLEKTKMEQEALEKQKQSLTIYSNIDGTVGNINFVDAAQQDASTSKNQIQIMTIYSHGPYQIQGTLTELQKNEIKSGLTIKVNAEAVPNQTWTGHMLAVSDYPTSDASDSVKGKDPQSSGQISTYEFNAQLDQSGNLFPGYHVNIHVELPFVINIPRSSVVKNGDAAYVYVAEKGMLKKRAVSVEVQDKKTYRVLEGLQQGDTILTNPSSNVHSGMKVNTK
jgi:HlyD family secretion protein